MRDALRHELAAAVDGEVRFDKVSRALYSTDASVYQIEPLGVVIPRSAEAVARAVEIAARHEVPITPRGGGTSQAGQSIGAGLVHGHDMRVLAERGECAHFAPESMACLFAVERTQEELYCDGPRVKSRVRREVDLAHSTGGDRRFDPIRADQSSRGESHEAKRLYAVDELRYRPALQRVQTSEEATRWWRFIAARRLERAWEQAQSKKRSTFQRSAKTRMPPSESPYSIVDSSQSSRGG